MERRELELDGPRTDTIDFFVPTHSHPRLFTFVRLNFFVSLILHSSWKHFVHPSILLSDTFFVPTFFIVYL